MAEKIVSPGVFTRERDLSFLPAAIGEIGAAVIGPTVKGPAFEPTIIESFKEFEAVFGPKSKETYVPYTVEQYLKSAGRVTIVRILGLSGYTLTNGIAVLKADVGLVGSKVSHTVAAFHPSQVDSDAKFTVLSGSASDVSGSGFLFYLSASAEDYSATTNVAVGITGHSVGGSTGFENINGAKTGETAYSMSLDSTSQFYLPKVFGKTPKDRKKPMYTYLFFGNHASRSMAVTSASNSAVAGITSVTGKGRNTVAWAHAYSTNKNELEARTPFIQSQKIGGKVVDLFKIHRRAHGTATNYEFKIAIDNIRAAGTVAGSDYGSFSLRLRRVDVDGSINAQMSPFAVSGDSDRRPDIIEQYNNLTLDPDSPNFIARVIGDKYQAIDANGKVTIKGDYANLSRHIYVEVPEEVKDKGISPALVPFGYAALTDPLPSTITNCPSSSIIGQANVTRTKKTQILDNVYNKNVYYGFDYADLDNHNYLKPVPSTNSGVGGNLAFNLSNEKQHPSASLNSGNETTITPGGATINLSTKKFVVPFQGGFDGFNPARFVGLDTNISAANLFGYDLSSAEKDGALAYKRAINAVSNPDEYDINMMVTPGANHRLHAVTTTHAKNTCEDRGDAFYVMDSAAYGDSIATVTNTVKAFDSNYAATYYPWVKILDTDINKPVWVPPSVVVPGAIAFNDQVAFEWFAPAGLNRGTLTEVIETADRVTHEERDDLYEGRVNPIATFPGQGVCIWGQKTLQGKPSALDRVNVRRLLIAVKKFIASATRYLVFENNTSATRNRFLNIANPYLESIQQRQGLYAFKVIMDATNNTPDVIDRNQMIGELFLQPAKAAEFIVLDFNILPTGAAFPE